MLCPGPFRMAEAVLELDAKRFVIFDLDGTLIDSNAAHARAYERALGERDPTFARRFDYERVRGLPTPVALERLGIDDAQEVERLTSLKRRFYLEALAAGEVQTYPGAQELVLCLSRSGRKLVVLTGASRRSALTVLDMTGLGAHMAGVVDASSLPAPKATAAPFEHCLQQFAMERPRTLVVEDALDGITGALAAGIDVVQVHRQTAPGVPFFSSLDELSQAFGV
jgi:HAD superfamily hydrolase (TIGR01509 family)